MEGGYRKIDVQPRSHGSSADEHHADLWDVWRWLEGHANDVSAAGKSSTSSWSAHFDGKDYPFVGTPAIDTIALTRIDASTFTSELKKEGKVVQRVRNAVSPDGKTITATQKGTNAKGQHYADVLVFEKQ
jgi:hypothetical protein